MIKTYDLFSITRDAKKKFHENLTAVLDFALPAPPLVSCNVKDDEQADCGICYAKHLPVGERIYHVPVLPTPLLLTSWFLNLDHSSFFSDPPDDELGAHSGCVTDYTCENPSCSRAFHSVCLRDWLRSITSTRQ